MAPISAVPAGGRRQARRQGRHPVAASEKDGLNAAEPDGTTALHWAAYRDDLESADLLLKAGAKANAANDLGATPLWNASQNGSVAMVKRLLDAGANPNTGAARGRNAGDGGRARRISRSRRTAARQGRQSERARHARADGAHVGRFAAASRRRQGADRARGRSQGSLGCLERGDGGAAAWISPLQLERSRTEARPR